MGYDQRFGAKCRIKRRQDFLRIQGKGKKYRSEHFLLALVPLSASALPQAQQVSVGSANHPQQSRLGITVTKKVNKRAARRNRLKRRIREFFRREREGFLQPVDIVVIALSGATELEFLSIVRELRFLLKKSRVLPHRRLKRVPVA